MHLYTYLPKLNTAMRLGILSTLKAPHGWLKYIQRSGKNTRLLVMRWLSLMDPDRPKAVSLFRDPIALTAPLEMLLFAKARLLYKVDYNKLKAMDLIESIIANTGKLPHRVKQPMSRHYDWSKAKRGLFLFSKVPHYLMAVKDGVIPVLAIEKQAAAKAISFPLELLLALRQRLANYSPIWTTRVSKDRTAYNKGDVLLNLLINEPLYVSLAQDISALQQHPFLKFLTPLQKQQLNKYKKMRILKLKPYSWGDNPIYNQTMGTLGKRYKIAKLIRAIKQHRLAPLMINILDIGTLNEKIDNTWGNGVYKEAPKLTVKQFAKEHLPRILNAELKYPILVSLDKKYVYDGLHRLMKTMLQNKKKIKAYRVPRSYLTLVLKLALNLGE